MRLCADGRRRCGCSCITVWHALDVRWEHSTRLRKQPLSTGYRSARFFPNFAMRLRRAISVLSPSESHLQPKAVAAFGRESSAQGIWAATCTGKDGRAIHSPQLRLPMPIMAFGFAGGSSCASFPPALCILESLKFHCVRMGKHATGMIRF